MALKDGDVIKISYTGKTIDTNQVFETTDKETAIKKGIYNKEAKYEPLTTIIGGNDLLKGLEEAIKEMKQGEEKKVNLNPKQAFGERNPEYIRMVPMQEFKKRDITPFPGLIIELNGMKGKIQTVSGGRIRVDFNHPLAGKTIEFQVKIEKILKKDKEKIDALTKKYFSFLTKPPQTKQEKNTLKIILPFLPLPEISQAKHLFAKQVIKAVPKIKNIQFIEKYEKKEEKTVKPKQKKQK